MRLPTPSKIWHFTLDIIAEIGVRSSRAGTEQRAEAPEERKRVPAVESVFRGEGIVESMDGFRGEWCDDVSVDVTGQGFWCSARQ